MESLDALHVALSVALAFTLCAGWIRGRAAKRTLRETLERYSGALKTISDLRHEAKVTMQTLQALPFQAETFAHDMGQGRDQAIKALLPQLSGDLFMLMLKRGCLRIEADHDKTARPARYLVRASILAYPIAQPSADPAAGPVPEGPDYTGSLTLPPSGPATPSAAPRVRR